MEPVSDEVIEKIKEFEDLGLKPRKINKKHSLKQVWIL
jgi:hypothetical protein